MALVNNTYLVNALPVIIFQAIAILLLMILVSVLLVDMALNAL